MTRKKHTGVLKLAAVIIAVLMAHSGSFSESATARYSVSLFNPTVFSKVAFTDTVSNQKATFQIGCPEDISTYTDINECTAEISNGLNINIINGSVASLTWKMTGATKDKSPSTGINQIEKYIFKTGVTFVDYTATDLAGKRWGCSFTVVVVDNQFPVLAAPKNITIHCNDRIPTPYTTLQAFFNAGGEASDNCSVRTSSFRLLSEKKDKNFCPYTITRVYEVADYAGNTTVAEQSVIVDLDVAEPSSPKTSDNRFPADVKITNAIAVKNGNWTDPGVWSGGAVPTPAYNVTIPSGITITIDDVAACNDIEIQMDGTLTSGAYTLKVYGNWTNLGTYAGGTSGTVEMAGFNHSFINGNTNFEELVVSKGSLTTALTINGNNSITSGGRLTMTSGLVTIPTGGSLEINQAAGLTIPAGAGFDITGGTLSTGNFSVNNEGLFRITAGTAKIGNAPGNELQTRATGALLVTGGTLNIAGALYNSASGTEAAPGGISGITITDGIVTLCTSGNRLSNMGTLYVTAAGNFNFIGGTIIFQRPSNSTAEIDLNLIAGIGSKNSKGGTFQFGNTATSTGSLFSVASEIPLHHITTVFNGNLRLKSTLTVHQTDLYPGSIIDLNGNAMRLAVEGYGIYHFPIGIGSGVSTPVTVNLKAGTFAPDAYIELKTAGKHAANNSTTHYLRRTWTLNTSGITNPVYDLKATFADADIAGIKSKIALGNWTGRLPWIKGNGVNTAENVLTATAVNSTGFVFTGITLDPPAVTISATENAVCFGEKVTLTASAEGDKPFTFSWKTNNSADTANTATCNITPAETTVYTLTVTDANGISTMASQTIEVKPLPEVSVSESTVEAGGTLILSPAEGGTWTSTNPAVATVDGATVTAISAGTASFIFTETATGCTNSTNEITVTQPAGNVLKSGMGIEAGPPAFITPGTTTFIVPAGVTQMTVELWGAGGGGSSRAGAAGGGGGGAYTRAFLTGLTPLSTVTIVVGTAGGVGTAGTFSRVTVGAYTITANGGASTNTRFGGAGGAAQAVGGAITAAYAGGIGGNGRGNSGGGNNEGGGGGGESASAASAGNAGGSTNSNTGGAGGTGTAGGDGGRGADGDGNPDASAGTGPGGGGGGRGENAGSTSKAGANGQVIISYEPPYVAQFTAMNIGSLTWCTGETRNITVTVRNIGSGIWSDASPDINIGVKWNGDPDYLVRVNAGGLAPGSSQTYTLSVTAPSAGANNLTFDVVNEGDCWFGNNNGSCGPGNSVYTSSNITINPQPTITLGSNPSVCRGTTTANLTYSAVTGSPNQYSINYDATANAAGFTDVNNAALPTSPIVLTIPGAATPNTYNATLTVRNSTTGCVSGTYDISVTVNAPSTISLTSGTQSPTVCAGTAITNTVYTFGGSATNATVSGLPAGLSQAVNVGAKTVTISGTPTASGTYTITTSGHTAPCTAATISGTVTVNAVSTISLTSGTQSPTVCAGTAITNTVYTFGGSATNATVSGLPAGLSQAVNVGAKTVTISGTPTASGTYTITTSGHTAPCTAATISGTVTVNAVSTISLTSGTQSPTVCAGTAITNTVYTFGGSATNATVSGLPAGLSQAVNVGAKTVTISGTPTASGTYTITTSGHTAPCTAATISGTVTVNAVSTISLTSGTQSPTVCAGTAITNTVYTFGGSATNATVSGLPAGLSQAVNVGAKTVTISGTPTASGTYTITTSGHTAPCTAATISGTVTVNAVSTISLTSGTQSPTVCAGTAITNTVYTFGGSATNATVSGLPAGLSQAVNVGAKTVTISGTPTASGTYTITTSGHTAPCTAATISGTVTVNAVSTISLTSGTQSPTVCAGTAITNTVYTFGGSATNATVSGLPAGLSQAVNVGAKTVTISGTPTASGTYTITTSGHTAPCTAATISGTVTVNAVSTISLTSGTQSPTVCAGTAITNTVYTFGGSATNATVSGLPAGLSQAVNVGAKTVTISGTPTASGTYTITTSGHTAPCTAATISGTVTVNAVSTISLTSGTQSPTVCAGTAITNTVYTFGGSATNATVSGLPAGLSQAVNVGAKTVTISGTPTASGTYTITTSGHTAPCTAATISGTVTVNAVSTISLTSGTQSPTVCAGTAITNTVYTFGGSATNATVSGLPAGLSQAVNVGAKTVTISGTPTASGTYTITTSGHTAPCTAATISGTVTVNAVSTISLTSGTQSPTVCAGTAITNTVYTFGGSATNATVSGLPAGLSQAVNVGAKTVTISGTPTASGTYTITTSGHTAPCTAATISGTVTVNAVSTISLTSGTQSPTVCAGTAITNTVYTFGGSATNATVSGLPAGLSQAVNVGAKTVTISGTPTASGTYTITTSGHTAPCTAATISGTVTVNAVSTISLTSGTQSPTVCAGTAITNTVYTFGGSATNATVSGLPAGLSQAVNVGAKTVTISGTTTASGTYTITTSGHTAPCTAATISGTVTVNPDATISLTSAAGTNAQNICINNAIADITYAIGGGGTGTTVSGLPAGVTGSFSAGVFTISGTPTGSGSFNYTVTTTGTCTQTSANGTITVNSDATISLTSAAGTNAQNICINNAITNITYAIGGGGTGATVSGLPAGIIGSFSAGVFTISGTPTGSGSFNYTVTTTGTCTQTSANGSITVNPDATISLTSAAGTNAQNICINNAITNITYAIGGGGTGATVSGLPAGVTGSFSAGVFTISGTPTGSGSFNYTVTTTGTCTQTTANGSIIVNPSSIGGTATADQTICNGSSPSDITLTGNTGTIQWQVSSDNVTFTDIAGANASPLTGAQMGILAATRYYRAVVTSGVCSSSNSNVVTVTVRPTPIASISGTTSVCQNTAAPDITFTNPMALPVKVTYNINSGANQTIDIAASATNTVTAPTNVVGPFAYNLVSVEYQSAPACSNAISGSATVTVRPETPATPGAITGSILVLPAAPGNVYSIAAVGNATTYTWTVPAGWSITAGQGTTSVTVTSGTATQDGNITVTAGNDCGTSAASILAVLVDQNLAIVTHPASQSECYYRSVLFEVTISGGGSPITYTWQRNTGSGWANIVGDPDITYPTSGSMLVNQVGSATNPGGAQYRVIVTDAGGTTVTSNAATLTVNRVQTMTGSLTTTICEGQSVTFTATTSGETPVSMQWEKDGVPVSGATSATITINNALPSDAGRYKLSVVFPITTPNNNPGNPNTCTLTSTLYRDLVVNPLPVLAGPSEVCAGQTINWTPNTGGTWVSNNPAVATITNAGVITGVTAGTATFTFTLTATGCSSTTGNITVHPLPTGVIAGNSSICAGQSTTFAVTLTGTAPWSVTYSDGTTPVTVSGINASPHTITVTPAVTSTYTLTAVSDAHCNAISLSGNAVVTVRPLPTATLSGNTTICAGSSANLSVTLTGVQPWTITYTDGTTPVTVSGINASPYTITVSPLATTTYSLTAVSDANCTGTSFTGNATVLVDNLPTASAGGSQNICVNGTATVIGAAAANGTILWTENGAGSITSGAATLTPVYTPAAGDAGNVVTLTMTVTSNNACGTSTATATYTITVDPLPTASAGGNQTICSNSTATVSGATATNGTILWSHNGSGSLAGATTLTPVYTAGATDSGNTVTLTMTVTSSNNCAPQTASATYTVIVLPEPQVNQPSNQVICTGSTTTMINFTTTNVVGSTTYSWTNSEPSIGLAASGNGNIIPFTGVNNGSAPVIATITVTPRLTVGGVSCDGPVKTFTITVNPVPVATAPIGLTYCNGILSDPFTLTGTPSGVVFDISGGASIGLANVNGVTEIPAFTPITGSATITMIPKANGCTGFPVTFNITVRPNPTATISGGATVCQNSVPPNIIISNPMALTVLVTYNINGVGGYTVNVPAGSNVAIGVPTNNAGTFIYDLVSVQYLATEPPTCPAPITGTATVNVVAQPVPVITGPTNICAEQTGNVYSTQAGMSNYVWSISAGGTITAGGNLTDNTVTVTWTTGGSHNVSVAYTNASGCSTFTPTVFPVNVYSLPTPTITGSTSSCLGATNKVYSTQPGMTNYQWTVSAGGTITAGGTTASSSVTVTWTTIGPQTITVNYKNANGCTASSATVKNITVNPLPVPTLSGPNLLCAGTTGNIYTTEAGMSSYVWTVSAGGTITSGGTSNSSTATVRWNTDGPQTISVSYTNTDGCTPSAPTSFPVTVNPKPAPTITGSTSVCIGSTGNVYTTEAGMSNYVWTIAAGGTITAGGGATDNSVTISWTTAGAKTVKVNYTNASGCTATTPTTSNVTVNALPTPAIAGPNSVCVGSTDKVYTTVAGMTNYQWTVSAGGTITSGGSSTDNEVTVTWNTAGPQTVSLNYTNANGCTALSPTVRNVTVNPLPTPTIAGAVTGCTGAAGTVYTTQAGMTGYTWQVSAGGTITAGGSGTDNTVTVVWNTSGAQTVSVNYYNANSCTALAPTVLNVNVLAPAPPTCPVYADVCSNTPFFNLTGGLPAGGVYAGPGVTFVGGNYRFTPATAGAGTHTITYTLATPCADQCSFTIKVKPAPVGSATPQTICSGDTTNIILHSTVPGTTYTWTAAVTSGTVTGFSNCAASCDTVIRQVLTNTSVRFPGSGAGTNGVVTYTVTATKDGCSSTFTVAATVRPDIRVYNLTWNSNFMEDYIEVCAGTEALSDNDIEIAIPPFTLVPANHFNNGGNWSPVILYGPSPDGPWIIAEGSWHGSYEWNVDLDYNNQLGYHYFVLQITDPVTGCVQYSNPAILNVVSSLTVDAGGPDFMCGVTPQTLTGAYVGGISAVGTTQGRWSITSLVPANGGVNGSLSSTALTSNPETVTYTPPAGYVGTVTLTLTTNDPDGGGTCVPITDTRTITIVPPNSFTGCFDLDNWPVTNANSNGTRDDSNEPCFVTIVGSDNLSGTPGTTDITRCTGTGALSFDWSFSTPQNNIVWHQEDQKVGSNSGTSIMQVVKPSNLTVGDLIIVTIHENNNTGNITSADGFNLIRRDFIASQVTVASLYKIATAADVARVTPYQFTIANNNASADDRIYASRITGHNTASPIGNHNGITQYLNYPGGQGYMSITIPSINTTSANSMLVTSLAVNIDSSTGNDVEYINSPIGTITMYYNDIESTSRVAQRIITSAGATGSQRFQWPSYNTRNRSNMYTAAQMFVINPATNETDDAYYLVNGVPTLLGNTNGASGSKTITVNAGDVIGFRAGTSTNTGGPGRLTVYNLTMPNDVPVITGIDSVITPGCQDAAFVPTFVDPAATDDCDTPVLKSGYPVTAPVVINGCDRSQTKTWIYVDDCGEESLPFVQTAVWYVKSPLSVSCPIDPDLPACTDAAVITDAYNIWKAGFVANGGCDVTTNMISIPPLILGNIACGDTLTFKFIATDVCGQKDSCTSTFTVKPLTVLDVYCPADPMLPACTDAATITAAYNTWKAGFTYSGGCAAVTDNIASIPALTDLTCGGKLEFIYMVENSCGQSQSCISTFTVATLTELEINVPAGVSLPICTETVDIQTAYDNWKAGFSTTGGCNVITNIASFPALTDLSCGGSLTFTFTAENGLAGCTNQLQETSTFTVADAPELTVSCPVDPNIAGCLGIQAITDAYDTWVDGFKAFGGCNVTTNIASIPPLGDLICNGQLTFTFIADNGSGSCADHAECTSTFTIGAASPIVVNTPADLTLQGCNTNQAIIDAFNAWKAQFGYTGGCNVTTSDLSAYLIPSSCGGTVTIEYTASDECGQSETRSASFTLNPDALTVSCPGDEVQAACQNQAAIDVAFAIWKAQFTFTGGCGTVATDLSAISAPSACGGTVIVNYTATDVCGQVSNCSAIFTIDAPSDVLQEPGFTNPVDITVYRDASCNYSADPAITGLPLNLTDNCGTVGTLTISYADSIAAGTCINELIIYRRWTVADECLNRTTKTQIITVTDNIAPVIVCAPDVNGIADNSECEATGVNLGTTTATDNCVLASLTGVRSDGFPITDPFPVGVTTITWTATDACGNSSTCIQTITMLDGINQPPTISCPSNVVQTADPNNCFLDNVIIPNPVATDNCEVATISWVMSGATVRSSALTGFNYVGGETFNVGLTTVTYMATDSAGNFATCAFTVTILDVTPPSIDINSCANVSDLAAPNNCSKVPGTLNDPVYLDSCWPIDSLVLRWTMTGATIGSGFGTVTDSAFNVGVTNVTYFVTDPDGNEDNCSFTVTIHDVTPPSVGIAGCEDVTDVADPNNCSKVPGSFVNPVYTDNCWPVDSLDLTYTITGATTGSGTGSVIGLSFNVGVSEVTYTITDPDNNSATCSFTVTIVDVTPPVVDIANCVDVSDVAAFNNCSKVPAALQDPLFSDTCWPLDSLILSWTMSGATTGSGFGTVTDSAFNVGVTNVVYTVTDPDGNIANCSFTVTILDVTPPSVGIAGCVNITDTTDPNNCTVIPGDINDPVYSDSCWPLDSLTITWEMTGSTIGSGIGSVRGESFNAGITTVTYTVSDPDGNTATCDFTVTIIPFNPPQFTAGCPPNVSATADPGVCEANLTIPDPTVNDPCNVGYTITNDRTGTANASGVYPVGTTFVTWTITPAVGTPTTCIQSVVVTDDEDPVIATCAAPRTFNDCSTAAITGPVFSTITAVSSYAEFSDGNNQGVATDNCGIVTVNYIDVASGSCPITIIRTWTLFDAAGNSATCDQTITVSETIPPVVACPANDTIPSDFNQAYSDYSLPDFGFSDNCTDSVDIDITWTLSGVTTGSGTGLIPKPYRFNLGLTTITYTFTDACGNVTNCVFTLYVLFPPDIDCLPPKTYNTDPGVCTHRLPTDVNNPGVPVNSTGETINWEYTIFNPDGSTGDTGSSTGVSPAPIDPYDFWLGESTIRWIGTNASGTDTCSQQITVIDIEPPTFTVIPMTDCVERLTSATYTGDADNIQYNPDYPDGDYKILHIGDTYLDIDLNTYHDNCCVLADGYSIRWTIDFEGTNPTEPSISGTGQPSTYKDPVSGDPLDIYLWGDGVTFQSRVHTISYWMTDCHGNETLLPVQTTITINPRPQLIKVN